MADERGRWYAARGWGFVLIFLAACLVLLTLATVFVWDAHSEGYSCGTVLDPTDLGRSGDGTCAYQFRWMWSGALLFMAVALVCSTAGTAIVVATSPRRRDRTPVQAP